MDFKVGLPRMRGSDVRDARRRMSLTQTELAEQLDCSRAHVARMERRGEVPMMLTLAMLHASWMHKLELEAADMAGNDPR